MSLHRLEEITHEVHALDPDNGQFHSECWELAALIIGQRANDLEPLCKDSALLFMEALLMWEALLARRNQRSPSFRIISHDES
jgi:hypothetical protein